MKLTEKTLLKAENKDGQGLTRQNLKNEIVFRFLKIVVEMKARSQKSVRQAGNIRNVTLFRAYGRTS